MPADPETTKERPEPGRADAELAPLMDAATLAGHGGAAVLIDKRFRVRYLEGAFGKFLAFSAGPLTYDLLAMARPDLRARLRRLCVLALEEGRLVRDTIAPGGGNGSLTVVPIRSQEETLLLVLFRETPGLRGATEPLPHSEAALTAELEQALEETRRDLAATIQKLEAANEKLRSSSEATAAVNEELRVANQELQSSRGELQSTNEALRIVNSQLKLKVQEAARTNADLENLVSATEIPTVFLDLDLRVQRYTPTACSLFHLIHSDVGRPLADIAPRFRDAALMADARAVSAAGPVPERLVPALDGRWYLRRVVPYRLGERRVAGIVLTFVDVTEQKALREEIVSIASLEQRRIGEELHDGTQQELTGLGLLAQSLAETLAAEGESRESALAAKLAAGIAEANRHVRDISRGLVPVTVAAGDLEAALAELGRRTLDRDRLSVALDYSAPVSIPSDLFATHLFRIAQEAVTNAVKHADARQIVIRLASEENEFRLEIADDGKGLPEARGNSGAGLRIMEHRCALLGGALALRARPGGGTVVSCVLPRTAALSGSATKRRRRETALGVTPASRTPT